MKIPIESSKKKKKSAYSVYVYGALDVRLFPNKRLNVDIKNIEIWVSHIRLLAPLFPGGPISYGRTEGGEGWRCRRFYMGSYGDLLY